MDPINTALATAGIEAASQEAQGFLRRIAGRAADEVGLMLQDRVRMYRFRNQLRMLGRAQEMVTEAGLPTRDVPLRLLLPLLDGASLEDDAGLSDKWAALLANAASSRDPQAVLPSFPHILGQMSPRDAEVLDKLYVSVADLEAIWATLPTIQLVETRAPAKEGPPPFGVAAKHLVEDLEIVPEELALVLDNLIGRGLVERSPSIRMDGSGDLFFGSPAEVRPTRLGRRLVEACKVPRAS